MRFLLLSLLSRRKRRAEREKKRKNEGKERERVRKKEREEERTKRPINQIVNQCSLFLPSLRWMMNFAEAVTCSSFQVSNFHSLFPSFLSLPILRLGINRSETFRIPLFPPNFSLVFFPTFVLLQLLFFCNTFQTPSLSTMLIPFFFSPCFDLWTSAYLHSNNFKKLPRNKNGMRERKRRRKKKRRFEGVRLFCSTDSRSLSLFSRSPPPKTPTADYDLSFFL